MRGNRRLGFEFKRTTMPQISKSLNIAMKDLQLSHAYIIHAGTISFPLSQTITAVALQEVPEKILD